MGGLLQGCLLGLRLLCGVVLRQRWRCFTHKGSMCYIGRGSVPVCAQRVKSYRDELVVAAAVLGYFIGLSRAKARASTRWCGQEYFILYEG